MGLEMPSVLGAHGGTGLLSATLCWAAHYPQAREPLLLRVEESRGLERDPRSEQGRLVQSRVGGLARALGAQASAQWTSVTFVLTTIFASLSCPLLQPPPSGPFTSSLGGAGFSDDPFKSKQDTPALPPKKPAPPRPKPPSGQYAFFSRSCRLPVQDGGGPGSPCSPAQSSSTCRRTLHGEQDGALVQPPGLCERRVCVVCTSCLLALALSCGPLGFWLCIGVHKALALELPLWPGAPCVASAQACHCHPDILAMLQEPLVAGSPVATLVSSPPSFSPHQRHLPSRGGKTEQQRDSLQAFCRRAPVPYTEAVALRGPSMSS
ncbi:hypothetical protein P7K49_033505 [Saguinus oedipus]|uniref:Uncharacterized protein n=1 Tax=Saguinus oedipus TaxID=9490 RepID=A0ABQ9TS34_SAGOE|nr:hypothetical protein P7K49_033505 [Saguinus oedipus]